MNTRKQFFDWLAIKESPRVLEIGTRGWGDDPPKHNKEEILQVCPSATWIGCDMLDGPGVDVIADAQHLRSVFKAESFDAIVSSWTFEHIARPWDAAEQIYQVLKKDGSVFIETHQSFPIHSYPEDYFRFTIPAMKELFWKMDCIHAEYLGNCRILPITNDVDNYDICKRWNFEAESYLIVVSFFRKVTA